jgi:hypothetical protein
MASIHVQRQITTRRQQEFQWPAKALSKVIRRTFGAHTPIQRCQIHKARNVTEQLPKPLHASVRRALRQAWELDDADKAERLLRNLARRRLVSPLAFSKGSTRC